MEGTTARTRINKGEIVTTNYPLCKKAARKGSGSERRRQFPDRIGGERLRGIDTRYFLTAEAERSRLIRLAVEFTYEQADVLGLDQFIDITDAGIRNNGKARGKILRGFWSANATESRRSLSQTSPKSAAIR
ncbi:MAG: hypothetical protein IPJ55_17510 [Chloracidobacterium sp.]|nr:hypothetical protein [Chloracidobacterium sp.]